MPLSDYHLYRPSFVVFLGAICHLIDYPVFRMPLFIIGRLKGVLTERSPRHTIWVDTLIGMAAEEVIMDRECADEKG